MALAPSLIKGFQYTVTGGMLEGEVVTIVDNTTFPDTDLDRRRKVTVRMADGTVDYILPRMLSNEPVGMEATAMPAYRPEPEVVVTTVPAEVDVPVAPAAATTVVSQAPITDPMDARLDHLRPSRTKVKRYIQRHMQNGMSDVEFLLTFTTADFRSDNEGRPQNIMLKGDTQAGKTFLVEVLAVAWADAMGLPKPMPIFTLSGSSGVTDYDLFGQTTSYTDPTTGRESLVWLPGVVDLASKVGGILYLDEANAMGERVTSSLHPLADHRHQFINRNKPVLKGGQFMPETVTASLDLWIIGTYNEGYRGMGKFNEAFAQRFEHIVWGYDDAVENKLIKSPTVRLLGEALRVARRQGTIRTPFGTKALQKFERNVKAFGVEMAAQVVLGMFDASERDVVEAIIQDRSILVLLNEEARQAEVENGA